MKAYAHLRQELEDHAFQHQQRPELYESLRADPQKRAAAQAELDRIQNMVPYGILDRDVISKNIHEMLTDMLRRLGDELPVTPANSPRIIEA